MKTVIEISKQDTDNILKRLERMEEALLAIAKEKKTLRDNYITLEEFGDKINIRGKSNLSYFRNGTHPSGFHVRTEKLPGTNTVWVPKSELDRYFKFGKK